MVHHPWLIKISGSMDIIQKALDLRSLKKDADETFPFFLTTDFGNYKNPSMVEYIEENAEEFRELLPYFSLALNFTFPIIEAFKFYTQGSVSYKIYAAQFFPEEWALSVTGLKGHLEGATIKLLHQNDAVNESYSACISNGIKLNDETFSNAVCWSIEIKNVDWIEEWVKPRILLGFDPVSRQSEKAFSEFCISRKLCKLFRPVDFGSGVHQLILDKLEEPEFLKWMDQNNVPRVLLWKHENCRKYHHRYGCVWDFD